MKKLMSVCALVLATCASAKEANLTVVGCNPPTTVLRDWTPLSVSIITPVALPPGFWDVKGLEVGGYNWTVDMTGLQVGFVNAADVVCGVQVGGINVTRQMYGLQIGFVNVIQDSDLVFFPVVNGRF